MHGTQSQMVQGLGFLAFTQAARVRFPVWEQFFDFSDFTSRQTASSFESILRLPPIVESPQFTSGKGFTDQNQIEVREKSGPNQHQRNFENLGLNRIDRSPDGPRTVRGSQFQAWFSRYSKFFCQVRCSIIANSNF